MPLCRAEIDRSFSKTIALNLLWRGRIRFQVANHPPAELEGPLAYWTYGGPRFIYGNVAGHGWHQLWVLAGGRRARRMVEGGLVPASVTPWGVPENPTQYLADFRRLIALVIHGRSESQTERAQLLEELFYTATSGAGLQPPPRHDVEELGERIATTPLDDYDFVTEARQMGVSYPHFRRRFTEQIGRAPQAYLLDCRMRWAAANLASEAASVKATAYATGFKDPRAFARQFFHRTGVAPHTLLWKNRSEQ